MTEERKLVTVLFADIVGSTAATAEEDPEVVRATLGRAFSQMRELLTAHGGTVEKFIGDAVMCVFGIPQAHDDDAERAVRAAFAMRATIAELSDRLAFPLQLRIGVNTGRVVAGAEGADTLVTGAPVNMAARLQQAASPGEILVGAVSAGLSRGAVRFGPARTLEAKGLGRIEGHLAEELLEAVPQQHRGLGPLSAPLIGRDLELRLLRDAWERTKAERSPALVTLYGQPGVGKSRLVAELVEVIGHGNVRRGRCLSYGSGITYWPLQETVRADAAVAGDDPPDVARAKVRAAALSAFGEPSEDAEAVAVRLLVLAGLARPEAAIPGVTGDDLARELRWAARRYFELHAQRSPLALVFDDIQWAEPALLDLIEHLAERSRAPLLVACMARPDLRETRPAWGSAIKNSTSIALEPLGPGETRRLIAALLSIDDLVEDLRSEIVRRAEGNPLYVEELLRMLLETGQIERRGGRFVAKGEVGELQIPPTLEGLLTARLDQLDPEAKRAVRVASVVGQVFYPGALRALGVPAREVEDALERAARRDLVLEHDERGPDGKPSWSFKHLLIRDAAYESLPKAERWNLHDALGRWLETVPSAGDLAGVIAYHAERAFWTARELREERADELGRRALDLTLAEARRARKLGALGAVIRDLYTRTSALASALGADASIGVEAQAHIVMERLEREGRDVLTELHEILATARRLGPSPTLVRLLLEAGFWEHLGGQVSELGMAYYAEAGSVAASLGDPELVLDVMSHEAEVRWWLGHVEEEVARRTEMLRYARAMDVHDREIRELRTLVQGNAALGRFEVALRYAGEFDEVVLGAANVQLRRRMPHEVAALRAEIAGDLGAWEIHARRHLEAAQELDASGWIGWARKGLAVVLYELARHEEALAEMEKAFEAMSRLGLKGFTGEFRQQYALALLGVGQVERALEQAELAYQEIVDPDPFSRHTTARTLGLVREAQGDLAEAERLLRHAVDCTAQYYWLAAEGRVELAKFLMRNRRPAEARPLLEAARDFYRLPHAKGWRDRVDELIAKCDAAAVA